MRSALAFAACLMGCLSKPTFECADSAACLQGGVQGTCQPDHLCSFPDPACPSGQRYGDLSGAQANQCVGDSGGGDAGTCLGGSGAYRLCVTPSTNPVMLAGPLDTDSDPRCAAPPASWIAAGQPDACVITGALAVGHTTVTGSKVLVLAGDAITIDGTLDVASHRGGTTGPGAPFAGCAGFPAGPESAPQGGGGGAGASFKTRGGNGGDGDGVADGGVPALPAEDPTVLRAGCAGQAGAAGSGAIGAVGQGGGAVFLAANTITFGASGAINASGAGAAGGGTFTGGSGGGSGGMIVLHAMTITAAAGARVVANGGGGAQGTSGFGTAPSGGDPNPATPTTPAPGGTGGTGGAGGNGFAGMTQAQAGGQNQNRGGGGGGGGGGYIQTSLAVANLTASPAATVAP